MKRSIAIHALLGLLCAASFAGCGSSSAQGGETLSLLGQFDFASGESIHTGSLMASSGMAFFVARTPDAGEEPWISDGTLSGTRRIMDIYQGPQNSMISPSDDQPAFVEWNGLVYFAADDGINGNELWRTDGSEAGTGMVADLLPGPDGFLAITMRPTGNRLFITLFAINDFSELWVLEVTP